jgi:hypothetical protein
MGGEPSGLRLTVSQSPADWDARRHCTRHTVLLKISRLPGRMSSIRIRLRSGRAELKVADDDCHQSQYGGDDAEDDGPCRVGVGFGQGRGHGGVHGRQRLEGRSGVERWHVYGV